MHAAQKTILKAPTYATFKKKLQTSDCDLCALSRERTQIVVDRGNPEAGIVIVGEAPGAEEDRTGKSFVGRSGKLLDTLLSESGINPERDCLIMNVVKCRPPANRPPKPAEAASCKPYFMKQIELIRPRFILLLGATALKHVLPHLKKEAMKDVVGKAFSSQELGEIQIMVVFHPAYILRDPRKKPEMLKLLQKFKKLTSAPALETC